jgi:hypothetical protein
MITEQQRLIDGIAAAFAKATPGTACVEERYGENLWYVVADNGEICQAGRQDAEKLAEAINSNHGHNVDVARLVATRVLW